MLRPFLHRSLLGLVGFVFAWPVCFSDDLTRPIRASDDGHFLMQPDGRPFFWLADTAWNLFHRLDRREADLYLRNRAGKGFTVIQAAVLCELACVTTPNRYGELPLVAGDVNRPNPRYFAHVDWVVNRARQYGVRMALLPTWGRSTVPGTTPLFTTEKAEGYAGWIAQRYRGQGIIWVLGGDVNPLWARNERGKDHTVVDYRPTYDAMARGILAGSGSDAFITYHLTPVAYSGTAVPRTSLYLGDRTWLAMNMIQSGHTDGGGDLHPGTPEQTGWIKHWRADLNYEPVAAEYSSFPTRPIIDGENCYEDIPKNLTSSTEYWDDVDTRRGAYQAVFAGAAGHTFGNNAIWQFYDPARTEPIIGPRQSWQDALDLPGAGQMVHLKNLMLSRPYFSRIPDQTVIEGDVGHGDTHLAATRDRDGNYLMVYSPQGQAFTVRLCALRGDAFVGWWFDPRTGSSRRLDRRIDATSHQMFRPPSSGRGQDWVLVLEDQAKHFPAPGTGLGGDETVTMESGRSSPDVLKGDYAVVAEAQKLQRSKLCDGQS